MKNNLKVALNINNLSVSEKINKARSFVDALTNNPGIFTNPSPALATVTTAVDDLETAWNDAVDGGKTRKALMHDKEKVMVKLLFDLAHYVEGVANNDETIVHLAGMEIKKTGHISVPDFEVVHAADRGAVRLRVKPATKKTVYRWEFCKDPIGNAPFTVAKTTTQAITNFGDLDEGVKYWFRVVFISDGGESVPYNPISIIVI